MEDREGEEGGKVGYASVTHTQGRRERRRKDRPGWLKVWK